MRIILLHSDEFEYEPKKKAIKSAEQIEMGIVSVEEALVAMMAVESEAVNESAASVCFVSSGLGTPSKKKESVR